MAAALPNFESPKYSALNRPYRPYGACEELFYSREPEVLLSGPAGTGKSRGCLEKLHFCCENWPGTRALILRKTRESLTEAALVTLEEKVIPPGHPCLNGPKRNMRQNYRYPNGSEIVVGGLDKASKVMSTEYDIAYIQEAIETEENDWESVTTRLRNGVMPFQQLIADTNPDKPTHWLYLRCVKAKLTKFIESLHEDNPTLWEWNKAQSGGKWTEFGRLYIGILDRLTGARYQRLRLGRWVASEGQIYSEYNPKIHLCDDFKPPQSWPRIWGVDFGYVNPFVWQQWVLSPDSDIYLHLEFYRTQTLVEDACHEIKQLVKDEPSPEVVICDHDAEDRATFERHMNLKTRRAFKDVSPGIQAVQTRLKPEERGDGTYVRMQFMRNARKRIDKDLETAKKPTSTIEEMDGYVWDPAAKQARGDVPLKEDDHGVDTARYVVCYVDKVKTSGTKVLTSQPNLATSTPEEVHYYGARNRQKRLLQMATRN